jgi:Tfp pilus assembly protein FimT
MIRSGDDRRARLAQAGSATVRGGFTLMEIVVVFVIVALATALSVPAWRRWFQEDDMTVATRRIEALFRLARDSAIRGGEPVTVVIDSVTGHVWLDAPRPPLIADSMYAPRTTLSVERAAEESKGESLELPLSVTIELTQARARFEFAPSGAAYADSLVLKAPMGLRLITVNPWTGDVVTH